MSPVVITCSFGSLKLQANTKNPDRKGRGRILCAFGKDQGFLVREPLTIVTKQLIFAISLGLNMHGPAPQIADLCERAVAVLRKQLPTIVVVPEI